MVDATAERVAAALHAYADTVEPTADWPGVVERLDRRSGPWHWITTHPLALGAAAATFVLLVIVGVSALTGGDDGRDDTQDVDFVGTDSESDHGFVAIDVEGRLVRLGADGTEQGVIAELVGSEADVAGGAAGAGDLAGGAAGAGDLAGGAAGAGDLAGGAAGAGDLAGVAAWAGDLAVTADGSTAYALASHAVEPGCNPPPPPVITAYSLTGEGDHEQWGGGPMGLSPDGTRMAFVDAAPGTALDGGDEPCSPERVLAVRSLLAGDPAATDRSIPTPENVAVTQVVWVEDLGVVVTGHGKDPAISSLSSSILSVWVVDPDASTELGTPLEVALPLDARLADAGSGDGDVLVAGPLDTEPFDLVVDDTRVGSPSAVSVWRGSLADGDAALIGVVDNATRPPGGTPTTAAPIPGPPQYVISLAAAPDGGAYLTVAEAAELGSGDPATGSPTLYRLPRPDDEDVVTGLDGGGEVGVVAEGILAAVPVPGDDTPPSGDGRDELIVAARPDGSVVRLDPTTGQVADQLAADADFPGSARLTGNEGPEATSLLGELAVASDGMVLQARPTSPDGECDTTFNADWDLFLVGDEGAGRLIGGDTPMPSRLPAISPDQSALAYLTTSNGERCDDALLVAVADRLSGETLATHALPVGVDVTGLMWSNEDRLVITHVAGSDGPMPGLIPVTVDARTSGPVDFGASSVGLSAPTVLAPSGGAEWPYLIGAAAWPLLTGAVIGVSLDDVYSDIAHEPPAAVDLPLTADEGAVVSIARDGADTVWITAGLGTPVWPLTDWDGYRTWRWVLPTEGRATALVDVDGAYVGVAAEPPREVEAIGSETGPGSPVTSDPEAPTPTTPTATGTPPSPAPTTVPPDDSSVDVAGGGYVYLDYDGQVLRSLDGTAAEVVAALPDWGEGSAPFRITVSPDGATLVGASTPSANTDCASSLWSVDLETGAVNDLGNGSVPAFSPDGTRLAYVASGERTDGTCPQAVVVQDLETGEERRFTDPVSHGESDAQDERALIRALVWDADSRALAFERAYEDVVVSVVDTEASRDALPVEPLVAGPESYGHPWSLTGYSPSATSFVLRAQCAPTTVCDDGDVPVTFVTASGEAVSGDGDGDLAPGLHASVAHWHDDGGWLFLQSTCPPTASCAGETLLLRPPDSDGTGDPVTIGPADGVVAAAWIP
jgi:hypothetical protein